VRAIVVVLDGVGAGAADDAERFGDAGADTLGHVASAVGGLRLPTLERLGLGCVAPIAGVAAPARPDAVTGRLAEASAAKDSAVGHWELMGLVTERAPPTYPDGFPPGVMEAFARATGRGWLCNAPASGTEAIARFGPEHLRTGALIVYTSADSVFQVAAHEDVVAREELDACCRAAREILTGPHAVLRVIARPFTGEPGAFVRTAGRRDLALPPTGPTALDLLSDAGVRVEGVGKIGQLFAGRGLTGDHPTADNADGVRTIRALLRGLEAGALVANLLDQDTLHGHRNDPRGFAACLERLDAGLAGVLGDLRPGDLLIVTADHGNDPTHPGTDHTRERVPLLAHVAGADHAGARWEGEFADVGRTLLARLGVEAGGAVAGRPIPLPDEVSPPRT
jgi:phosphopentomutase